MNKCYRFVLVVLVLFLAACKTAPEKETDYVFKEMPAALRQPVKHIPPPDTQKYVAATPDEQEKMWVDVYRKHEIEVAKANRQLILQAEWEAKQKANYEKKEVP